MAKINYREIRLETAEHYKEMSEHSPAARVRWWFIRPAYQISGLSDQARRLIKAQGM